MLLAHINYICIMGPTASGKSRLAIALLNAIPAEIINVDSVLIYQGMDIGTAKPKREELACYPHHLIDILPPTATYSVFQFCEDAKRLIQEIRARGHLPILVGGTMMYFKSLLFGLSGLPKADAQIRQRIEAIANKKGWEFWHRFLQKCDPQSALRIHAHDPQRLQRAVEVLCISGRPLSSWFADADSALPNILQPKNLAIDSVSVSPPAVLSFGLIPEDRVYLHQQIALRFERMLAEGFVEEVQGLRQWPGISENSPAMRAVGYRQIWQYLSGSHDERTMREKVLAATRQLAKRQLTWLRQWPNLIRLDPLVQDGAEQILKKIQPISR